jgi:hypothetical protein
VFLNITKLCWIILISPAFKVSFSSTRTILFSCHEVKPIHIASSLLTRSLHRIF